MRLFVAIDIPARTREILANLRVVIPGVRWVPAEQLHLTLLFLGEIEPENLERLCSALADITVPPFSLTFDRTGCFPNPGTPKVLWAGIRQEPLLTRLALRVKAAAELCGIRTEERPFSPHITLARCRQGAPPELADFTRRPVCSERLTVPVREFILYQSTLTRQGPIHEALREFRLSA